MVNILLLQHYYVTDFATDTAQISEGMEFTGIPEGIPSLAKYLGEYCSSAVSPMVVIINLI